MTRLIPSARRLCVCALLLLNVNMAGWGMPVPDDSVSAVYSRRIAELKDKMSSHRNAGGVYQTYQMRQVARTYSEWALKLKNSGNYPEAAHVYALALQEYEHIDSTLLGDKIAADRFTLCMNQCELLLRRGMYDSALELLADNPPPMEQSRCIWLHHQAEAFTYLGRYDEALSLYEQLEGTTCYSPSTIDANRGYLLEEMGRYAEALESLRRAAAHTTDDFQRHIILSNEALLLSRTGHGEEALSTIDQCVTWLLKTYGEHHPDYIIALRKRAEILQKSGDVRAVEAFRRFFAKESELLTSQYDALDPQARLDLWYTHKPLLSECFSLELDHDDFLYDVALFRRGMTFLRHDESPSSLVGTTAESVRSTLPSDGAALEFVVYERDSTPAIMEWP